MTAKLIIICVFALLLIAWAIWDREASWECYLHGDCRDWWHGIVCSRCGYTESRTEAEGIENLPKRCPKCGRRMK